MSVFKECTLLRVQRTYLDVVFVMKVQRLFEIVMRVPPVDVARPMIAPLMCIKLCI